MRVSWQRSTAKVFFETLKIIARVMKEPVELDSSYNGNGTKQAIEFLLDDKADVMSELLIMNQERMKVLNFSYPLC